MSQLYAYDGLNQLTSFERGTLNSGDTAITGTPSATETWALDAAGNFTSVTTNGTEVDRTTNAQNEVTAVGSGSLTYDGNGNTTTDDQGHTLIYDAWNRLVAVKSGSTVIAGYSYDGLSRRITETHSGTTTILLQSAGDQVVEEITSESWTTYFWDPTAVDAPVFRDVYNSTTDIDVQVYALTTADGDVAALMNNSSGSVVERYAYDPYGSVTFLTPTYGSRSSSSYGWVYLHQGLRWDSIVDLYDNRARAYSPTLMRFLQNDPIGFMAGDANTYRYEGDDPTGMIDPGGLQVITTQPGPVIHAPDLNEWPWAETGPFSVGWAQFDLASDDPGGPTDRVRVSSIAQIADYLDSHVKKGTCLSRIQIGSHGGNGFLTRDASAQGNTEAVLSQSTFDNAASYALHPDYYPNKKVDAETIAALRRIQGHLCPGGKLELIGCSILNPASPYAVKFINNMESIFGKGSVIAYADSKIWTLEGDVITVDEMKRRTSGVIGKLIDFIRNPCIVRTVKGMIK